MQIKGADNRSFLLLPSPILLCNDFFYFLYKIAVKEELAKHTLKEIKLRDFSMKHDFDFIWTKGSIYAEEYEFICDELTLFTE